MTKLFSGGVKALAIASLLATSACATPGGLGPMASVNKAAAQAVPPLESDPAAQTFEFLKTLNFVVFIEDGFDDQGRLRIRKEMTYQEASAVAQISNYCATRIKEEVDGVGWLVLKRTVRAGGSQTVGSAVSTLLGFEAPTADTYRQVVGLTTGTAFFAAWDSADFQVFMIISALHGQCTNDLVKKNPRVVGSITIGVSPGLGGKPPKVMKPGVEAPIPD